MLAISIILNAALILLWIYDRFRSKSVPKHPCNCDACKTERSGVELKKANLRYQYVSYYRGQQEIGDYNTYIRYTDKQSPGILTMTVSNEYWNEHLCNLHIKSMNDHFAWKESQQENTNLLIKVD